MHEGYERKKLATKREQKKRELVFFSSCFERVEWAVERKRERERERESTWVGGRVRYAGEQR